jgi:glycerol kinase
VDPGWRAVSVLVVDVGTTGLRAAIVRDDGTIAAMHHSPCPPSAPAPGLVEFDPGAMARLALAACEAVLAEAGPVRAVGVTAQRASTLAWRRSTGEPLGPGIGWQDLRTVGDCISLRTTHGLVFAPNQTGTKAAWLVHHGLGDAPLDDVCIGTIDAWIVRALTGGDAHVTDPSHACVSGAYDVDAATWDARVLGLLGVPPECMPRVVGSHGPIAAARALPGAPPIAALVGDQQSSLVGQGCVRAGDAKITFGTGGMLDVCTGHERPAVLARSAHGTYPLVAYGPGAAGEPRSSGASASPTRTVWAREAICISAGSNVEWLREDMGLVASAEETDALAASVPDAGGVTYVPALLGIGTPHWDYGARGTLLGLTRGATRAHVVRAVLEGVAHRGADLLDAARADTGLAPAALRIDGGMSRNDTFVQALADATGLPVEASAVTEATTLGAAYLAGAAVGVWPSVEAAAATRRARRVAHPARPLDRSQWHEAVRRSRGWIPALSALDF